jgi:hypothetical protein
MNLIEGRLTRACSGASVTAANWPCCRVVKEKANEEASRSSWASTLIETPLHAIHRTIPFPDHDISFEVRMPKFQESLDFYPWIPVISRA